MNETVRPGQLWSLHSDVRMSALIVSANPDDFTYWPVVDYTKDAEEGSLVALRSGQGGADLLVWPAIETGCSTAVLSRRLGTVLSIDAMHVLRHAWIHEEELTQPWIRGTAPAGEAQSAMVFATSLLESF